MKKIYEMLLGLVSSLVLFLSPTEAKKITNLSNDYHIPDVCKISSLGDVDLVPIPPPLILKRADFGAGDMFAAHRSHRSHSSHRSHTSHRSGSTSPSRIPETTLPSEPSSPSTSPVPSRVPESTKPVVPSETEKSSTSAPIVPQQPSSIRPSDSSIKEWRTSAEWVSEPCKLSYHEVVIYLHDDTRFQGMVTGCQENSIQITKEVSGAGGTKQWIRINDVKALLWR